MATVGPSSLRFACVRFQALRPADAECRAEWEDGLATRVRVWKWIAGLPEPLGYNYPHLTLLRQTPWQIRLAVTPPERTYPAPNYGNPDDPDSGLLKVTSWRFRLADAANRGNERIWTAVAAGVAD